MLASLRSRVGGGLGTFNPGLRSRTRFSRGYHMSGLQAHCSQADARRRAEQCSALRRRSMEVGSQEPGDERGGGEAGKVIAKLDFFQLKDDEGDAEDEHAGGGVDGVDKMVLHEEGFEPVHQERDGSLVNKDGHRRKRDARPVDAHETHRGEAVHDHLDGERLPVAVEAVLDGADDAERSGAKEHGADNEAFVEAVGVAGFDLAETAAGELAEAIEAFLDVQDAAGQSSDDERENEHDQSLDDAGEVVAQADAGDVEAEDDGDEAHEAAPEELRGRGELAVEHQTHQGAKEDADGVEEGSGDSGQHAKTEPCGGTGSKGKMRMARLILRLSPDKAEAHLNRPTPHP
jgi:hypothetical protein